MESQEPNPHIYAPLNDVGENNPNVHLNFNKTESEGGKSVAYYRGSASGRQAASPEDSNQMQEKAQYKGWSACFGVFYGFMLISNILSSGSKLIMMIYLAVNEGIVTHPLEFVVEGWLTALCILAFSGFWKRDLGRVEKALMMIKIQYPLKAVYYLSLSFEAKDVQEEPEKLVFGVLVTGVMDLVSFTLLIFLTTRKIRNALRLAPKEEGLPKEDCNPIEKFDSFIFKIYQAVLLIFFFWDAKILLGAAYEDFLDLPKFFGKMMSETSYLMLQIQGYSLFPLSLVFFFLAFEGLRRKNLEKVLAAIKLMKIYIVARFILSVLRAIPTYHEGKLHEEFQRSLPGSDIKSGWSLLAYFLLNEVVCGLVTYLHVYFASKVRDILKDHQKAGHAL